MSEARLRPHEARDTWAPTRAFGARSDGTPTRLLAVQSETHLALFTDYGARLVRLIERKTGADLVLGFESAAAYEADQTFQGAIIGRFANRIRGGQFTLDGVTHYLDRNWRGHTLHGGMGGFHRRIWHISQHTADMVHFHLLSPDGDQGFPGNVGIDAVWHLNGATLRLECRATTDAPTPISLTAHPYFNLGGDNDIYAHTLQIDADATTPCGEDGLPRGVIEMIALDDRLDFRAPRALSAAWLNEPRPLDDNLVMRPGGRARLRHPLTGRTLMIESTLPGLQVYGGEGLGEGPAGHHGKTYQRHAGICLEPQFFPDAPNVQRFPSPILRPGAQYRHEICYHFGTDADDSAAYR